MTIPTVLTPVRWLVLDNLAHGWAYDANVNARLVGEARDWCMKHGYVDDMGRITDEGKDALVRLPIERPRIWRKRLGSGAR
jgi:hypothetical protein